MQNLKFKYLRKIQLHNYVYFLVFKRDLQFIVERACYLWVCKSSDQFMICSPTIDQNLQCLLFSCFATQLIQNERVRMSRQKIIVPVLSTNDFNENFSSI